MAEPATLQTLLEYLTPISLTVGVVYYILTLQNTRKNQQLTLETRQAQLFMEMYNKWTDMDRSRIEGEVMSWEYLDLENGQEKYGSDPENRRKLGNSAGFYEGLGVLVNRGLLNPVLVDDLISGNIISYWEETESLWKAIRERYNYPQVAQWAEYLYNEVRQIMLDEHPELVDKVCRNKKIINYNQEPLLFFTPYSFLNINIM